jgi:hypothetical protein
LLPTRDAGGSDAAAAGARIGSVSLAADAHDPAIIMAALGRVANGIASEPSPAHSLFTPATSAVPVTASVGSSAAASVFALDSAPAPEPVPAVAAVPDAAEVPEAATGLSTATAGGGKPGWTPTVVKPVPGADRGPRTRRSVPPKSLIAAIAIIVCLAATIWALFS